MKAPHSLFAYRPGTTPVHRAHAGIKLVIYCAFSVAAFASAPGLSPTALLGALSAFLTVLALLARTPAGTVGRNAGILFWYALFILAFRIAGKEVSPEALRGELVFSGLYIWRLALVLFAGSVFYETTPNLEIRHTLSAFQRNIGRPFGLTLPFRLPDAGFLLSLTITFIPRVFETWTALELSWAARGGNRRRGLAGAVRKTAVLVPLLVSALLAVAADTDRAIRNRTPGSDPGISR